MKLHFREYGEGQPFVILHGLFGSSDNWLTQAKLFAPHYKVYNIDLRNHGLSPHSDDFDYRVMADDVLEFIEDHQLKDAIVMGHSMGGKTAMNFAVAHPEKLSKLIVVDIAPRAYNLEHYTIAEGLKAIDLETLSSRNDADDALSKYVDEAGVRQFLLKNLQRKPEGGFSWKINLKVISEKLSNVGFDLQYKGKFEKPTLFIHGKRSNYVTEKDWPRITEVFPNAILETLDTGHWVQAEKPQEFVDVVSKWLRKYN